MIGFRKSLSSRTPTLLVGVRDLLSPRFLHMLVPFCLVLA